MIEINSEELKSGINRIIKAARRADTREMQIHIQTLADQLVVYFENETISVEEKLPVIVKKEMRFTVSLNELDSKVKALPKNTTIGLECRKDTFFFSWASRNSNLKLSTHSNETPFLTVPKAEKEIKWPAGMLQYITRYMAPFTSEQSAIESQPSRAFLTGISFSKNSSGATIIKATDTHRGVGFTAAKLEWFENEVILNLNALKGVGEVIGNDKEITIGLSDKTRVIFKSGNSTVICKAMVGSMPDFLAYYKQDTPCKVYLDRLTVIELCERVRLSSPTNPVIVFHAEKNKIYAEVQGVLKELIPGSVEGEMIPFAVNEKHLREASILLSMCGKDEEMAIFTEKSNTSLLSVGYEGFANVSIVVSQTRSQYVAALSKNKEVS